MKRFDVGIIWFVIGLISLSLYLSTTEFADRNPSFLLVVGLVGVLKGIDEMAKVVKHETAYLIIISILVIAAVALNWTNTLDYKTDILISGILLLIAIINFVNVLFHFGLWDSMVRVWRKETLEKNLTHIGTIIGLIGVIFFYDLPTLLMCCMLLATPVFYLAAMIIVVMKNEAEEIYKDDFLKNFLLLLILIGITGLVFVEITTRPYNPQLNDTIARITVVFMILSQNTGIFYKT